MANIPSVLVVEDDEGTLEVLAQLLESGLAIGKVQPTRSAEEALAALRRQRFALILSDYQLCGMDGVQLLEGLRACGDETPFLLLTGVPDTGGVLRALRQTRVDVLGKPFRISELATAMERLRAA